MVTFDVASVDRLGELECGGPGRRGDRGRPPCLEPRVWDDQPHRSVGGGIGPAGVQAHTRTGVADRPGGGHLPAHRVGDRHRQIPVREHILGDVAGGGRHGGGGGSSRVIGRHVYEESPFGYLGVQAAVLGRAVLEQDRSMVWSVLHASDLERHGIGIEDTDPLIDAMQGGARGRGGCAAQGGRRFGQGEPAVSWSVDVGTVAVALGGGGHHNASGLTHPGRPRRPSPRSVAAARRTADGGMASGFLFVDKPPGHDVARRRCGASSPSG